MSLKRARMKRLIRKAHAPIPPFNIHLGPGPAYPELTYFNWQTIRGPVLYWQGPLSSQADVRDFYHECGHAFDQLCLTATLRAQATLLLTHHPRPWYWDRDPRTITTTPDPLCETFADAYAELCTSPRRRPQLRRLVLNAWSTSIHGGGSAT